MRYRGENFVENSVNERYREWDLEDIAGDNLSATAFAPRITVTTLSQCVDVNAPVHVQQVNSWTQFVATTPRNSRVHSSGQFGVGRKRTYVHAGPISW
jgi:hypothetical protein